MAGQPCLIAELWVTVRDFVIKNKMNWGGIIFLYTVEMCHSYRFNKKRSGHQLGRICEAERMLGRRQRHERDISVAEPTAWALQGKGSQAM